MDRRCESCGNEPGAGAFCQHCGTALDSAPPPTAEERRDTAGSSGDVPDVLAGSFAGLDPSTTSGSAPTPEPTPPPQVVYVQAPSEPSPQPSRGSTKGCGIGCGVIGIVAILAVAVAGYFGWQWYQANVAPTVEGIGTAFEDGLGGFAEGADTVGPCYDLEVDDAGTVVGWADVDCGGSRDAEVFHVWRFRDGSFPGAETLADEAFDTCVVWFEDYVGVPYFESTLLIDWLVPTATLWAAGDRDGVCLVRAVRGPLTGPVKGAER